MDNKLFCTFSSLKSLSKLVKKLENGFRIKHNKIFILYSTETDEYICTYNIEDSSKNVNFLPNTILVHRKKEYNTLYTINALNKVIEEINNGILDPKFSVPWENYKNCILLTDGDKLKKLPTKVHKILKV